MKKESEFTKEVLEKDFPDAPDVEVLKDRPEPVADLSVKPWGFDEIEALTPVFEKIYSDLKRRKISLTDFYHVVKTEVGGTPSTKIELLNFEQLYFVIMPHLREIFKITLHVDDKEISEIDPESMMTLLLKIVMQNIGYLKNWLALAMSLTARTVV
jgi:hypothetical protein